MEDQGSSDERLDLELELLRSMYPDTFFFDAKAREISFSVNQQSNDKLVLRLGPSYPTQGSPEIISARNATGTDLRQQMKKLVQKACASTGDPDSPGEVLDAVIAEYMDIAGSGEIDDHERLVSSASEQRDTPKTVIIWLHHLLATGKRKLAIHPTVSADKVRGLTKPGYPGVLVFSGEKSAVDDHVLELKNQNWQAFAVRYEEDELWNFAEGVRELETMAEAVQCVEESRRELFLKVIGVK
jgi:hypothetical protein